MRVLLIEDLKKVQIVFSYCKIKDFDQLVAIIKSFDGWKFEMASKTWFLPKKWMDELMQKFSTINIRTTVFKKEEETQDKMKLIYDDDSSRTEPLKTDYGQELKRKKVFDDVSNQLTVIEVIKSCDNLLIKLPIDPMAYFSLKRKEFLVWEDNTTWKIEKDQHEEFFKACDANFIKIKYLN